MEADSTRFRPPSGPDAEFGLRARATLDDQEFAALLASTFSLTW